MLLNLWLLAIVPYVSINAYILQPKLLLWMAAVAQNIRKIEEHTISSSTAWPEEREGLGTYHSVMSSAT